MLSRSKILLFVLVSLPSLLAFVVPPATTTTAVQKVSSSTLLRDSEEGAAAPLPLSSSDLSRLAAVKSRHLTLPIMIMDAMVPGQTISFESADPKFHNLVEYVLTEGNHNEIGMIGFNPHTGRPLNIGVTLEVTPQNIKRGKKKENVLTLTCTAKRQFEVQGEPWMHNHENDKEQIITGTNNPRASQSSFYLAHVEIVDGRPEEALPDDVAQSAQNLFDKIPDLVEEWMQLMIAKKTNKKTTKNKQQQQQNSLSGNVKARMMMMELGPMPDEFKDRAVWVAALLNPCTSHSTSAEEEPVCSEIRPAMLACKSDHDRLVLANAALRSSIDYLSGEKKLF